MTNIPFYASVEIPESMQYAWQSITRIRHLLDNNDLLYDQFLDIEKDLLTHIPPLDNEYQPIETYTPDMFTSENLRVLFESDIRPIVIKGYAKKSPCTTLWTPEYLKKNYGDFPIFYTSTQHIINDDGTTLSAFIDQVLEGNMDRSYIENLSNIFNTYPELHQHLELNQIKDRLTGYAKYINIAQLFLGGRGTGASLHCANELNCFLNIYGKKEWIFIHPKYSLCLYPTLMNNGIFVGSPVKHRANKRFLAHEYPLYNAIPKLKITLEPGDLLINPPWWWHAINNKTDVTISVATRWAITQHYHRQNPTFDLIQDLTATESWRQMSESLAKDLCVVPDDKNRKSYREYDRMGFFDRHNVPDKKHDMTSLSTSI